MSDHVRLKMGVLEWREVEGEIVALDLRRSVYLAVNRSGAALWPLLVDGATHDALVARVRDECEIDGDVATADIDRFLAELRKNDLLEER